MTGGAIFPNNDLIAASESDVKYNLLDKRFIYCVFKDGSCRPRSLMEMLQQAGEIIDFRHPCSQDDFAVYRFLLALLAWVESCCDVDQLRVRWKNGLPGSLLNELKERVGSRFDLFHANNPFLQDSRLPKTKTRPVTDLLAELPTGTNINHFRHVYDQTASLCPACCVRGILRLPIFSTPRKHGAKEQMPSGINGSPPGYFLPVGDCLMETLLLNWPTCRIEGDRPVWEEGADTVERTGKVGILEGFTWPCRRMLLDVPNKNSSLCIACGVLSNAGDPAIVSRIVFLPGRNPALKCNRSWHDPHVCYQQERTPSGKRRAKSPTSVPYHAADPMGASRGCNSWSQIARCILRSLDPMPPEESITAVRLAQKRLPEGRSLQVRCFLFSTDQDKKVHDASAVWTIPAHVRRDPSSVRELNAELDRIERLGTELRQRWIREKWTALFNDPKKPRTRGDWPILVAAALAEFEAEVEQTFRQLLAGFDREALWKRVQELAAKCFIEPAVRMAADPLEQCDLRHRMEAAIADSFKREGA